MRRLAARGTLARRIALIIAANTLVLVAMVVTMLVVERRMRERLAAATQDYVEEQAIADRVSDAIVRQIVAAASFRDRPDSTVRESAFAASAGADLAIRSYLFRDLTVDQRLQLERIKELHQSLEVAAANAMEFHQHGATDSGARSGRMARDALALQGALDEFLRMRRDRLGALRDRQAYAFGIMSTTFLVLAIVLLVGMLLTARFLQHRIAEPLATFSDAAARLGAGNLDTRVATGTSDEFVALAESFNRMADRLADARAALERRNRELERTVGELRTTQAELVQTEKMGAIGRMMAGLAHELNNPLASVLGFAELLDERLRDEPASSELRTGFVEPLLAEAKRARELVRGLLRFSRRSSMTMEPVPLRETLDLVARLRAHEFQQAGLELRVEDVPETHVVAESQRLQQVFLNIVNNALDAMRDGDGRGRQLRVSGAIDDGRVDVVFDDDGGGIAEPERVFEPFYTTKPQGHGTGLGLSLVHRFMHEFGGGITAANRPDGGARFTLRFRRADPPAEPSTAEAETERTAAASAATAAPRVLVVDDEEMLLVIQRRTLKRLDAEVSVAKSADEARAILERQDVDVVITDVRMPGGSGIDLYRWIERERPELADRVMFVTGDPGSAGLDGLGVDLDGRLIYKPFVLQDYVDAVAAVLAARG